MMSNIIENFEMISKFINTLFQTSSAIKLTATKIVGYTQRFFDGFNLLYVIDNEDINDFNTMVDEA